jgi:hypothetical protein
MNESRPEADVEYSRATVASEGLSGRLDGVSAAPAKGRSAAPSNDRAGVPLYAARMLAVAAAIALLVAEPLALIRVQTAAGHRVVLTVTAGSHHSYALIPIALLALVLAWALGRPPADRAAALALVGLGLAVLGIALLGDLPEIHRTGLIGRAATGLHDARTVAGAGLYIETLGAILLLAAGVVALVAGLRPRPETRSSTLQSGGRRSAS